MLELAIVICVACGVTALLAFVADWTGERAERKGRELFEKGGR